MSSSTPTPQPPSTEFKPSVFQYRKPVRGSLVWWLRFLGVIAFVSILLRLPGPKDVEAFQIDLRWLGFCMLLTIIQLLLEVFVWQWLMSIQRIRHPYPKTLVAYLGSRYLGLVTPGHAGEFLAAGYVSTETGITVGYALSSVVMNKAIAWLTIVGFGVWSVQLLPQVPFLQGIRWAAAASCIVLIALSLGISLWIFSLRRLARKWEKLSPWQIDLVELKSGMRRLISFRLIPAVAIACLAFSLLFLQLDMILHSLGIVLPILLVAKIVAFSRIVARVVPISVVGFGSKDAAVIGLLYQQGIDMATGLTATLLFLMCSYLVTLLLSGLCWWIKPLVIRRAAPTKA